MSNGCTFCTGKKQKSSKDLVYLRDCSHKKMIKLNDTQKENFSQDFQSKNLNSELIYT